MQNSRIADHRKRFNCFRAGAGSFGLGFYRNDRLDESLAKDVKESSKKQSEKDRRDESKGMEKSKGKGAYSSDPKMS